MLSNPPTSIHARQRQHRRQNSTPSALEGVNISALPNAANRRQAAAHRRGLSLDMRRQHTTPQAARQDFNKVRMTTNNTGLASNPQHHVLREAQQQRIQARPGPNQMQYASMASNDSENFLISPHGTPQAQRFDSSSCFDTNALQFNPYGAQLNMMMQKNQENYANNIAETKTFELYSNDSTLSTPTFMNFPDSPAGQAWSADEAGSRRNSRRISDGIMDRVSKFESMGIEEPQRPTTPQNQNGTSKSFTPFCNNSKLLTKITKVTILLRQWRLPTTAWPSKKLDQTDFQMSMTNPWKKPSSQTATIALVPERSLSLQR